jgi:RsiW-degrading membrane proteinase PrsW (M82 family)
MCYNLRKADMNRKTISLRHIAPLLAGLLAPVAVLAQEADDAVLGMSNETLTVIGWVAAGALLGCVLARAWMHIFHHLLLEHEPLNSIEQRQHRTPRLRMVIATIAATGVLFVLSLHVLDGIAPFSTIPSHRLLAGFLAFGVVAILLQIKWRSARDDIFAIFVGTGTVFCLMGFSQALLSEGVKENPYVTALGIVCIIVLWRFLFGPWVPRIKAVVLGTFVFWIAMHVIFQESPDERGAYLLAAAVALVPALVWCWFFLEYHAQRKSLVLLMFFAGMLSTAPILFYDALVRHGVEFQFFLLRVVPENFNSISNAFVSGNIVNVTGIQSTVLSVLISFLIVGFIEELSKFWVLKQSGKHFFTSIDDVIQLATIVAIGFAFAENVLNPSYFLAFVREFLIDAETPQWWAFLGNVSGRSILTTMVHIVSSGVMGYFLGLAIFAKPYLEERHRRGKVAIVADTAHWILRVPAKNIFRVQMMVIGLVLATALHGLFNFMVTLPDLLPGQPQTFGDLFGSADASLLHMIPILLLPSFLYIVGGFWLFTALFYRKENMKERGQLVTTDTFVTGQVVS